MLKKISNVLFKLISKNFGWKLFSLVCAIILWFIVMNIINPTEIQTYSVNVTLENEDKLNEKGFTVMNKEEIQNTKIEIKVKSSRTALDELNKNKKDITATVDLKQFAMIYASDINETFKVSVTPNIPTSYVYTYELVNFTPAEVSVKLDNIVEEEKEVIVDSEGEVSDGYLAGKSVVTPSIVTVKGASSIVSKIECVKALVDLSDISEQVTENIKPLAYDKDGNEINSVSFNPETVQVSFGVYKYGQIPVEQPTIEGNVADGYEITNIEWQPQNIEVIGDEEELNKVKSIKPVVRVNGESDEKLVKTYSVDANFAKTKINIKSGTKRDVTVTLTISKIEHQEITLKKENITFEGNSEGNEVTLLDDAKIKVKKDDADKLNQEDIKASINVTGLLEGRHSVEIIPILPDGISVSEKNTVDIQINKKSNEKENEPTSVLQSEEATG